MAYKKSKFNIALRTGVVEEREGYIDSDLGLTFYKAHKGGWMCSDYATGVLLSYGDSRQAAVEYITRLNILKFRDDREKYSKFKIINT